MLRWLRNQPESIAAFVGMRLRSKFDVGLRSWIIPR